MSQSHDSGLSELKKEIRYLRDRQDILDCINKYGRGLDRLDVDLVRNAYHPDAVDNHGPFIGGMDSFVPFAIECEAAFLQTHHGITSHNCEIEGDEAHAESYVFWFVRQPDGVNIGGGGGRYIDRLERREGAWKIAARQLLMDWTFEVPAKSWLGSDWETVIGSRDRDDPSYARPFQIDVS